MASKQCHCCSCKDDLKSRVTAIEDFLRKGQPSNSYFSLVTSRASTDQDCYCCSCKNKLNSRVTAIEEFLSKGQPNNSIPNKERNVVILGRVGAGKATLGNTIAGHKMFELSDPIASTTRGARDKNNDSKTVTVNGVTYQLSIYLLDIYGLQNETKLTYDIESMPDVNLLLFVSMYGRFTSEEGKYLKSVIRKLNVSAKEISALAITGCENLTEEARDEAIADLMQSESTQEIADFMTKGIFMVGFPDLSYIQKNFRETFAKSIEKDKQKLWEVLETCEVPQSSQKLSLSMASKILHTSPSISKCFVS